MILVTVGMQLGFDRLIEAMDRFASDYDGEIIAQIGKGRYVPRDMQFAPGFEAARFDELVGAADLVVSHAGIGSVLTARRHRKPIVLVPRRAQLGEHRNDHQLATARQLEGKPAIHIAFDERDLPRAIQTALGGPAPDWAGTSDGHGTRSELLDAIREFIDSPH